MTSCWNWCTSTFASRETETRKKESPMERDPVCGMNVDPERAKAKVEHGGKTHYFCSVGCSMRFEQAPDQFFAAVTPGAPSPGIQIATAAKPSMVSLPVLAATPKVKDPVCGMMVDPQKAAGKAEHAGETYFF